MMNKKLAMTIAGVGLIGVIGIGATLAYLTDVTTQVTNTFALGDVKFYDPNDDPEDPPCPPSDIDELGHGLWESEVGKDDSGNWQRDLDGNNVWTKTKMEYTGLVPGENVKKDPTVILSSKSMDAYVLAKVTYNSAQFNEPNFTNQWTKIDSLTETNGDLVTVYLLHNGPMTGGYANASTIFTDVTVDGGIQTTYRNETITNADGSTTTVRVVDSVKDKNGKTIEVTEVDGKYSMKLDEIIIKAAAIQYKGVDQNTAVSETHALLRDQ